MQAQRASGQETLAHGDTEVRPKGNFQGGGGFGMQQQGMGEYNMGGFDQNMMMQMNMMNPYGMGGGYDMMGMQDTGTGFQAGFDPNLMQMNQMGMMGGNQMGMMGMNPNMMPQMGQGQQGMYQQNPNQNNEPEGEESD